MSTNVVPIPTTDASAVSTEVTPDPTGVSKTRIGYPTNKSANGVDETVEFKKNLIASGCPDVPVVVVIPVIIPENPIISELLIFVIVSIFGDGDSTITLGGLEAKYPSPGLVIIGDVIEPPDTEIVAVAVVPTPTPIELGAAILTVTEPVYPAPAFVIDSEDIVPAADTTAVTPAETNPESWTSSRSNPAIAVLLTSFS